MGRARVLDGSTARVMAIIVPVAFHPPSIRQIDPGSRSCIRRRPARSARAASLYHGAMAESPTASVRAMRDRAFAAVRAGRQDEALTICTGGLAVPRQLDGVDDDSDGERIALLELAVLSARLTGATYPSRMVSARLPHVERQYYEAFVDASAGDTSCGLFAHALRADPFHPAGRYALAQRLAERGAHEDAAHHLKAVRTDGDPAAFERYASDPVFAPMAARVAEVAAAYPHACHALCVVQLGPVFRAADARLVPRPGADLYCARGNDLDIGRLLCFKGEFVPTDEDPALYFHMAGDRLYFCYRSLHRALMRLAPRVEDVEILVWNWNTGGWLESIDITDGRCVIDRRPTAGIDTGTFARMQLIEERMRARPERASYREALADELVSLACSSIDEGPPAPDDAVLAWAERALELAPDAPSAAEARRARAAVLGRPGAGAGDPPP